MSSRADLTKMKVAELREILEAAGADSTGLKAALIDRILALNGESEDGKSGDTAAAGEEGKAQVEEEVKIVQSEAAPAVSGAMTDAERIRARAERFGLPLASEREESNGTATATAKPTVGARTAASVLPAELVSAEALAARQAKFGVVAVDEPKPRRVQKNRNPKKVKESAAGGVTGGGVEKKKRNRRRFSRGKGGGHQQA